MTTTTVQVDQPTLERLAPLSLVINTNVRTTVDLEPLFVASIAEHGVQTPLVGHRDEHGQVVVDQGQRRTLAAVEAGLTEIPVYVHPYAPDDADRIVEQLTENEHRAPLGQADLVAAVEQLALVGYTPAQIAKRVSIPKGTAAAAAKVAGSKVAVEHLQTMTLEDAAVLVEFEHDEAAVERLTREAGYGRGLASTAERIRQDYAEAEAVEAKRVELRAAGVTVLDVAPHWDDKTTLRLDYLRNAGDKKISAAKHATSCPGHVEWVETGWKDGEYGPVAVPGCKGWKKHGHSSSLSSAGGGRVSAADMTDDERETARLERRHVVESNKDWKAATTVRRKWLREFALRTAAPTGAEQLIAAAVSQGWSNVEGYQRSPMWDLSGLTADGVAGELQAGAARGRALHLSLVICLAAWEAELADDAWRYGDNRQRRAALVLQAIAQWGHQLSAIEERVVEGTATKVHADA